MQKGNPLPINAGLGMGIIWNAVGCGQCPSGKEFCFCTFGLRWDSF